MCTEVNSVMGLQATAATKRKHEITFDGKEANTYTNCSPPVKVSKWSKASSLAEALEEKVLHTKSAIASQNHNRNNKINNKNNISNNNNNNSSIINNNTNNSNNNTNSKSKNGGDFNGSKKTPTSATAATPRPTTVTTTATTTATGFLNGNEVTKSLGIIPLVPNMAPEVTCSATTPLPPSASSPVPEDSIAKLEEVAAAHCEPWHAPNAEPVDCISKLQAVAVPSDPWGSIATRSTLATTLLSADEIDDDDDDFEDDYEEEESIIPTYCPLRYHPFAATPASALQQQRAANYAPSATHSSTYGGSRPSYYSEPFPQQNCSRTGGPQHLRMSNGGGAAFPQWPSASGGQQFYVPPEAEYPPPQQQQTIRCAENGKSYLDLGCSTPPPPLPSMSASDTSAAPSPLAPPYSSIQHVSATALEARHALKRCCEGRGTWCNTNKHCYKDIRMKIRNLSMFKLSRFRQVSEQSLYRSVLICNTLKYIDREIEAETKEIHQAVHAAHQQHHHTQYQHLHHPHHLQHHLHHHHNLMQHNHLQPQPHMQQQSPPPPQQQHVEYSPVLSCARVANLDYQPLQHQPSPQQQHQPQHFQQQHQPHLYNSNHNVERLASSSLPYLSVPLQEQQKAPTTPIAFANSSNNCDPSSPALASLHPYDHYPFRESQSGRATPFPNQPVILPTPASTPTQQHQQQSEHDQQQQQPLQSLVGTSSAVSSTPIVSNASATTATTTDADSNYADDDCTRSINWSSVLSLSSQSALDPLNNNELFSIIPDEPASTSSVNNNASSGNTAAAQNEADSTTSSTAVSISGSFTAVQAAAPGSTNGLSSQCVTSAANRLCSSSNQSGSPSATTSTATFTTLSTISSATYSMTSSYASSLSQQAASSTAAASSSWEYGFLDMDFGLGSEFTELMPSCKLSSDDLFKNGLTPVATSRYSSVHDNELEQPAHIMVGS